MDTEGKEKKDFSKMKLSELLKYDCDDSESDMDENDLFIDVENDENYKSPEPDLADSNTNPTLDDGAEKTNVNPINTNPILSNQELVEAKPVDHENKISILRTVLEGKPKAKSRRQRTKEYRMRLKANRFKQNPKSLPTAHVLKKYLETISFLQTDMQNHSENTD